MGLLDLPFQKKKDTAQAPNTVVGAQTPPGQMAMNSDKNLTPEKKMEKEAKRNREAIITGLAMFRVVWNGDFCRDWWFFMKQTHVIIGIFGCHKLHPYSQRERIVVLCIFVVASAGLSYSWLDGNAELPDGTADKSYLVVSVTIAVILAAWNFVVVKAARCGIAQEGRCLYCKGAGKTACEWFGKTVIFVSGVVAAIVLVAGYAIGTENNVPLRRALRTIALSLVESWIIGLASCALQFWFYWFGCCNDCCNYTCGSGQAGWYDKQPDWAYPYGPEYPTDKRLMWENDRCSCRDPNEEEI